MLRVAIAALCLYITIKKYNRNMGMDKYDREFYKRNNIFSVEQFMIYLFVFDGIMEYIGGISQTDPSDKIACVLAGSLYFFSAILEYIIQNRD